MEEPRATRLPRESSRSAFPVQECLNKPSEWSGRPSRLVAGQEIGGNEGACRHRGTLGKVPGKCVDLLRCEGLPAGRVIHDSRDGPPRNRLSCFIRVVKCRIPFGDTARARRGYARSMLRLTKLQLGVGIYRHALSGPDDVLPAIFVKMLDGVK